MRVIYRPRELLDIQSMEEIVWKNAEGTIRIGTAIVDEREEDRPRNIPRVTAINMATVHGPKVFVQRLARALRIDIQETPFEEEETI